MIAIMNAMTWPVAFALVGSVACVCGLVGYVVRELNRPDE